MADKNGQRLETRDRAVSGVSRPITSTSSLVVLLLGFCGFVEYSVVMPSMWLYLQSLGGSRVFYGFIIGGFSAIRVVFMPIFGRLSDKYDMRSFLILTSLIQVGGSVVYALAQPFEATWLILLGRLVIGVGAANNTMISSYFTRCSTKEDRTFQFSINSAATTLGLIIGPAWNAIIELIHISYGKFEFNVYTGPGWLMAAVNLLMVVLIFCLFEEPPRVPDTVEQAQRLTRRRTSIVLLSKMENMSLYAKFCYYLSTRYIWIMMVVSFDTEFVMSMLETITAPVTNVQFGWKAMQNSYFFMGLAVVALVATLTTAFGSKYVSDRQFLFVGNSMLGCVAISTFFIWAGSKIPLASFLGSAFFLLLAVPMQRSSSQGLFTKMLGADIGFFLGLYQMLNGTARAIGPLWGGYALQLAETTGSYLYVMIPVGVGSGISFLSLLFFWKYLDPDYHDEQLLQTSESEALLKNQASEEEQAKGNGEGGYGSIA